MAAHPSNVPVGILVAERASRADVLEQFGIDYCCGGKLSIRWFCDTQGLDLEAVLTALEASDRLPAPTRTRDWNQAPLSELIAHVVSTHHAHLRTTLPRLGDLLALVAATHAMAQPELTELVGVYADFQSEMQAHMDQEEQVVFPLIIRLERGLEDRALGERFLTQQLARMDAEHQEAGKDLERMSRLTQGFTPPRDACDSHRALLVGLFELVADTHRHVHKENSILFPRAAALVGRGPRKPPARAGASPNRGPIVFPEKCPLDPTRDEATRAMTHRGGLVSARAELH
ncbi:MAG: iron-sulfur cluster repair di-iron protein [Candidatus Sericytochromatia bacterium]